jgi:hypothetical protein
MAAVYRVKLADNDNVYFVFPVDTAAEAKKLASEALEGAWGAKPKLTATKEDYHSTVGNRFRFPFEGRTYRCTSYDSRQGFWMENVDDAKDRRNVSERAIGRTFHRIYEDLDSVE